MTRRIFVLIGFGILVLSFQNFSPWVEQFDRRPGTYSKLEYKFDAGAEPKRSEDLDRSSELANGKSGPPMVPFMKSKTKMDSSLTNSKAASDADSGSKLVVPKGFRGVGKYNDLSHEEIEKHWDNIERLACLKSKNSSNNEGTSWSFQMIDRTGNARLKYDGIVHLAADLDLVQSQSRLIFSKEITNNAELKVDMRPSDKTSAVQIHWAW